MTSLTEEQYQAKIRELEKEVKKLNLIIQKDSKTKYGLRWIDVPEAFEKESENKIPILEELKEKAIKNDDGKPTHILIEGDNYHVLKCLNYTHKGKIDVIYIDPPYNTGSDGFSYKDSRFLNEYPDGRAISKDDPLRHSSWLSFMNKRLLLAKNLLKETGVIFISINEDEFCQLKLLCDSLFGQNNYITTFTIKVRHEDRILKGDKPIHETTEQLLMYQKSDMFKIQKRTKDNSTPEGYEYKITELTQNPKTIILGDKEIQVFNPEEYKIEKVKSDFSNLKKINIRGSIKTGNSSGRFHMKYLEQRNNDFNVLYKVPDIGDDGLGYRYFLSRKDEKQANGSYFQGCPLYREDIKEIPYANYFDFEEEFNEVGTEGGVPFDGGKKPIDFIQHFLNIAFNKQNLTVLDFFAGSGSTCHAVIDKNFRGESNTCISIQSPELTYEIKNGHKNALTGCTNVYNAGFERIIDVTYQRIKNVILGFKTKKQQEVPGLGNSLKYYRTSFIGENEAEYATDKDKLTLSKKAGCLLSMAENTLEEYISTDRYQIFGDDKNSFTGIYFSANADKISEFTAKLEQLRNLSSLNVINAYFFSSGDGTEFSDEFESRKNIKIKSIPEPILEVYRRLN